MTIFNSAYATHATTGYVTNKIQQALEGQYYHGNTSPYKEGVHALERSANDVPAFNYPFICKLKDSSIAFFDARTLMTSNREGYSRIRDEVEYQARAIQAQLALDWHSGYQTRVRDITPLGLVVYSHWLGEVIAKRFALDALTQLHVSVFAGIFYINNFWDKVEAEKEDIGYLYSALTRLCGYKNSDVTDIVDSYPIIRGVEEFCDFIKQYTQNVRLEDLNPATLYGVVKGSWFINTGAETVSIALEYPPVWLTMLFQALTNRGFKKAGLTQIIERNSYRKYHDEFIRSMAYLGVSDR